MNRRCVLNFGLAPCFPVLAASDQQDAVRISTLSEADRATSIPKHIPGCVSGIKIIDEDGRTKQIGPSATKIGALKGAGTRALVNLLAAVLLSLHLAAPAETLVLTTEQSAPFNMMVDGKIVGVAVDKLTVLMRRAEQPYTMRLLPWARAYQMALHERQTCVFSTTRTPQREADFKWVGPLGSNTWVMYGLARRGLRLNSLDDARGMKIGTYNGDVRETYLKAIGHDVDSAVNDSRNPRKLLIGRIDLWASSPHEAIPQLEANGWRGEIVPLLTFKRTDLYLACSRSVSSALVERLNGLLADMMADGTTEAIERRYERSGN
jgi:polar amino acid transport system substrate-binding protein